MVLYGASGWSMSSLAPLSRYLFPTLPLRGSWTQADISPKARGRTGEKRPTYKQHKLSVNVHGSRHPGVVWVGTEWCWLGEARSQQASDQTLQFIISNHSHCLEPQQGYYGILRDFLHSLTLPVTDSYLL